MTLTDRAPGETIRVAEGGLRLDRFLARRFPRCSREYLKTLIARGCVRVGGDVRAADLRLAGGEIVTVRWPECAWPEIPIDRWVIAEDEWILVLNKPAGVLMHPTGETWLRTPEACLSEPEPNLAGLLFRYRHGIVAAGTPRCGLAHRLDRETSGVLVAAKTPQAHGRLVAAFGGRRVAKTYRAVVWGNLEEAVEVEAPVGRIGGRRRLRVTPFGRQSSTSFRVIEAGRGATLVEASPTTGRTHQIRVHLAHIGHPVLGDPEAGRSCRTRREETDFAPPRLMLHSYRLGFPHPRDGKPVRYCAPLPKDFKDYWRRRRA